MGPAQVLGHGEPVGLGQHDVQDDDVVKPCLAVLHAGLPVVHDIGGIPVVLENASERLGEAGVVFHDQNVHGGPFAGVAGVRFIVAAHLKAT